MKSVLKRLVSILVCVTMLTTMLSTFSVMAADDTATQLADMAKIKDRLAQYFLTTNSVNLASVSEAATYLANQNEDGSWPDLDYYDRTHTANGAIWQPEIACDRMEAMAIAYQTEGNPNYKSEAMLAGVQKALEHWRTIRDANPEKDDYEGPYCDNWWNNGHGMSQSFGQIGMLLYNELTQDNIDMMCRKLNRDGDKGSGQNPLWGTQSALYRALLENNAAYFKKTVDQCLAINLRVCYDMWDEGLMVDNSFHAHGDLMYSNGYGAHLIKDLSLWIHILRDTEFALSREVLDMMADYILDGNRWMTRGDLLEIGTTYQNYDTNWSYENYALALQRMIESDPQNAAEYQKYLDNISGKRADTGLSGNKFMWTSAYMAQQRKEYAVNTRGDSAGMKSTEWRATWPDEELGCLVFWTTAGMTTVAVDGDEYSSVLQTYDWRHLPGTTTPYYFSDRYNDFDNNNDVTIGVSNGQQGAFSYKYEKTDIRPKSDNEYSGATTGGNLSYFYFDDEYVALGTNLHSNHKAPIHSTINQTKADAPAVNGTAIPAETEEAAFEANWVYNNKIGYIFPETTSVKVANRDQTGLYPSLWDPTEVNVNDTFSLWIDHGVAPTAAEYAYIVLPAASPDEVEAYAQSNPITIVANNKLVQAVSHSGLKQTQVNFYAAGELEYATGKTVQVNAPCSLIIDESGATPAISMAGANITPDNVIEVVLTTDAKSYRSTMKTGAEPYTGEPVTMMAGDTTFVTAGESAADSYAGLAFDGDASTQWTAASLADSHITYDMQSSLDLNQMTITWGENYATAYEVLTSTDGQEWTSAYKTTTGDGEVDVIALSATGVYWKLNVTATANGGGVDVKEITFQDKDFAYATPTYPDMTALKAAIAKKVQENIYSEDSLANYKKVLNKANKLLVLPYATDDMVTATIAELGTAFENLEIGRIGSVMATVKLQNPVVKVHKQTMGTPWTALDNSLDLTERDLSKIYLFFKMDVEVEEERNGMFTSGRILLRSANTDGKENAAYMIVDTLDIRVGENLFYIPLSALNLQTNKMDWADTSTFRMYIDSVNQFDMDMTFTFSDIQILDSEYRPADSAEKVELKALLKAQKTNLSEYTIESVNAYNALFNEGWKVYKNTAASDEEVAAMLAQVKAADSLLKMDENSKVVLGTILEGEKLTGEGHHIKAEIKLDAPIDITGYEEGQVYLQFDFRVDTTNPNPGTQWLQYVKNGKVELGETAIATRTVVVNPFHCNQQVTSGGAWVTLRYTLPQVMLDKGAVQTFFMFLYNDTAALGTDAGGYTWDNGKGVTFGVRNVKILADKKSDEPVIPVNKDALNTVITEADKITDLAVYTDDSAKAFTDALTAAKAVSANADATQTEVDNAKKGLEDAHNGLTLKPVEPEITLGDVNENSSVTAEDALLALQIATDKINPTDDQKSAADVDKNGDVTANDALLILQFATKKINQF